MTTELGRAHVVVKVHHNNPTTELGRSIVPSKLTLEVLLTLPTVDRSESGTSVLYEASQDGLIEIAFNGSSERERGAVCQSSIIQFEDKLFSIGRTSFRY